MEILLQYSLLIISTLGYAGVGLVLTLNSMGIPFPSEIILPITGIAIHQGGVSAIEVVAAAIIGQLAGATASYFIGAKGGLPLLHRYGKYILISERELIITHHWFKRYGRVVALLGYCLPFIRGYIGYVAGVARMPWYQFIGSATIGITIWTLVLTSLGYYAGANLEVAENDLHLLGIVVAVAVLIGVLYIGVIRTRKGTRKK